MDWTHQITEEYDDGYDDGYDLYYSEYGCDFPDICLMPSLHFRYECYTKEMAEDWASGEGEE